MSAISVEFIGFPLSFDSDCLQVKAVCGLTNKPQLAIIRVLGFIYIIIIKKNL